MIEMLALSYYASKMIFLKFVVNQCINTNVHNSFPWCATSSFRLTSRRFLVIVQVVFALHYTYFWIYHKRWRHDEIKKKTKQNKPSRRMDSITFWDCRIISIILRQQETGNRVSKKSWLPIEWKRHYLTQSWEILHSSVSNSITSFKYNSNGSVSGLTMLRCNLTPIWHTTREGCFYRNGPWSITKQDLISKGLYYSYIL